ncbi:MULTISPECIES: HAD hydrolase-like protein [unclassified Corynebacterium]|uniref:HAD hydrolase-like protein n=1 Tax=unclassified Corynebacterium TaxID=2624378 RepID=UPI0030A4D2B0
MTSTANVSPPTVLIDVDGTISDSLPGIQNGFRVAMAAIDHPAPDAAFMAKLAGPPMVESMAALGLSPAAVATAMDAYMHQQRSGGWADTTMFDGWPELLTSWRDSGFRLATATSKGEHFAKKVLDTFGLLEFFDFIGAADDSGSRRTKSAVIEYTLQGLGIAYTDEQGELLWPSGVVMVGDRIHDFASATQFGLPSIAVGWGYGDDEERALASSTAASPEDLDAEVRRLLALS